MAACHFRGVSGDDMAASEAGQGVRGRYSSFLGAIQRLRACIQSSKPVLRVVKGCG